MAWKGILVSERLCDAGRNTYLALDGEEALERDEQREQPDVQRARCQVRAWEV